MPFSCWEEDGDEDAASEKISESVPNGHRPHPCCVLLSVNFGSPALTGKAMPAFDWLTDSPASSAGTGVGSYPWRPGCRHITGALFSVRPEDAAVYRLERVCSGPQDSVGQTLRQ